MNSPQTPPDFSYDPFSLAAMRDPQSLYPTLLEHFPAYYMPAYDAYAISRYADVWDGYLDGEHFSESEGQLFSREQLLVHHRGDPPKPQIDPPSIFLFMDPPVQTKFRKVLNPSFTKPAIGALAKDLTTLVRERLDGLLPQGRFDLNADFGSYVSVGGTSIVMGLPLSDTGHIISLVNRMVARAPGTPGGTPDGVVARDELMGFLTQAVADRRAGKGAESPVIDGLIGADLIGRPLSDEEVASDLLSILVGGTETVPKVTAGGLLELWKRPDQLAAVKADLATTVAPAYEEMLRYCAPAQWFGRTVKRKRALAGVELELGQRVILLIAAANRDPREFDDPNAFLWNRHPRRMLSFGVGPHFCIGVHLARLEGQIMLRELLDRVDSFQIHPEDGDWAVSEFQIGWTKLPISIG